MSKKVMILIISSVIWLTSCDGGIGVLGIPLIQIDPSVTIKLDRATQDAISRANGTLEKINTTLASGIKLDDKVLAVISELTAQIEEFNKTGILGSQGIASVNAAIEVINHLVDVVAGGIDVN